MIILCLNLALSGCSATETKNYSKEELNALIIENQNIKDNAHNMANYGRALGWNDDDKIIKEIKAKWNDANDKENYYQNLLNNIVAKEEEAKRQAEEEAKKLAEEQEAKKQAEAKRKAEEAETKRKAEEAKWINKATEYPAATQIWRYMKAQGWNDYVCAGIMGNLMAEVGGQTLNIRYTLSSGNYYGMCQWSRGYSEVWGAGLEGQCNFLRDTIKYEFDTYGFKYQKGFNFNSFLNMTDAQQAALAFAKSYERCGSGSYNVRQKNALKAYNYFVS